MLCIECWLLYTCTYMYVVHLQMRLMLCIECWLLYSLYSDHLLQEWRAASKWTIYITVRFAIWCALYNVFLRYPKLLNELFIWNLDAWPLCRMQLPFFQGGGGLFGGYCTVVCYNYHNNACRELPGAICLPVCTTPPSLYTRASLWASVLCLCVKLTVMCACLCMIR